MGKLTGLRESDFLRELQLQQKEAERRFRLDQKRMIEMSDYSLKPKGPPPACSHPVIMEQVTPTNGRQLRITRTCEVCSEVIARHVRIGQADKPTALYMVREGPHYKPVTYGAMEERKLVEQKERQLLMGGFKKKGGPPPQKGDDYSFGLSFDELQQLFGPPRGDPPKKGQLENTSTQKPDDLGRYKLWGKELCATPLEDAKQLLMLLFDMKLEERDSPWHIQMSIDALLEYFDLEPVSDGFGNIRFVDKRKKAPEPEPEPEPKPEPEPVKVELSEFALAFRKQWDALSEDQRGASERTALIHGLAA